MRRKPEDTAEIEQLDRAESHGVQVLSRAAQILRLLKSNPAGMLQAEVAESLGLARTTVHRLMNALSAEGLVQQTARSARYRLGPEILRMADAARNAVLEEIHPFLVRLSREVDETVDLSVLDGSRATFVDQVIAPHRLRAVSVVGTSFPVHCTANGRAMLAALPEAEATKLLGDKLEALTIETIIDAKAILKLLAGIRKGEPALDIEEHSLGICAVGFAVETSSLGLAAISVPMPTQRFHQKRHEVTAALRRIVDEIKALG